MNSYLPNSEPRGWLELRCSVRGATLQCCPKGCINRGDIERRRRVIAQEITESERGSAEFLVTAMRSDLGNKQTILLLS
jgi:hypothetical protein